MSLNMDKQKEENVNYLEFHYYKHIDPILSFSYSFVTHIYLNYKNWPSKILICSPL